MGRGERAGAYLALHVSSASHSVASDADGAAGAHRRPCGARQQVTPWRATSTSPCASQSGQCMHTGLPSLETPEVSSDIQRVCHHVARGVTWLTPDGGLSAGARRVQCGSGQPRHLCTRAGRCVPHMTEGVEQAVLLTKVCTKVVPHEASTGRRRPVPPASRLPLTLAHDCP